MKKADIKAGIGLYVAMRREALRKEIDDLETQLNKLKTPLSAAIKKRDAFFGSEANRNKLSKSILVQIGEGGIPYQIGTVVLSWRHKGMYSLLCREVGGAFDNITEFLVDANTLRQMAFETSRSFAQKVGKVLYDAENTDEEVNEMVKSLAKVKSELELLSVRGTPPSIRDKAVLVAETMSPNADTQVFADALADAVMGQ